MAYKHKELDQLKRMSPTALKREEGKAWITLHKFFNGKADKKEACEANKTISHMIRLRNQETRDLRLRLRVAALLKKHRSHFPEMLSPSSS